MWRHFLGKTILVSCDNYNIAVNRWIKASKLKSRALNLITNSMGYVFDVTWIMVSIIQPREKKNEKQLLTIGLRLSIELNWSREEERKSGRFSLFRSNTNRNPLWCQIRWLNEMKTMNFAPGHSVTYNSKQFSASNTSCWVVAVQNRNATHHTHNGLFGNLLD